MTVKIIADSVSDIPERLREELDITIVPLLVNFEDGSYRDGVDLKSDEFFEKLAKANKLPTTSQVNPGEFVEVFKEYVEEDQEVICINMASKMSGTYNAAISAVEILGTDLISVIDSECISFGTGLIVVNAARMAKAGKSRQEIVDQIRYDVENMECKFLVDTLEFLQKGGRLSRSEAFVGNLLNIKPILTIIDGELKAEGKVRGRKKGIKYIVNWVKENNIDLNGKVIGLYHATDYEYMHELRDAILDEFPNLEIIESEVGTVVGTHSGPGCIALSFVK